MGKWELENLSQFPVWNYMPYAQHLGQKTWLEKNNDKKKSYLKFMQMDSHKSV